MDNPLSDLLKHIKTDSEFKARVAARGQRERDRQRPLWRKHTEAYTRRAENKLKVAARLAVRRAIGAGELRPDLEVCALRHSDGPVIKCSGRMEADHWHGYDEAHWLDVRWLCRHHHRKVKKSSH